MQNTLKSEVNQNSKKTKFQLFSLIGVLAVTVIIGGIYYLLQPESVPPSLEVKRSTYQGFSKDIEFGSVKWEKSDLKVNEDKLAELKKAGVNTGTAVKAEKDRTNILFAIKDTNLKEIVDATSRIEGGRIIWAVYQGTFLMTQNDYFNTVDSKGNVVAKIVDISNTVELEKIKIKENQAVFLMADYDASNPLLRNELDAPSKDVTLDSLTKGWHVLAMKDAATLLKDVDETAYSLFGTKNNKDFAKLKTLDEKKNYNKIVWINVKVDKLTKQVSVKPEENIAPVVTGKAVVVAAIDSAQNMPIQWTVVDTKQTQYTDSAKTKPTLSYTWKFFDITNPATPVELWKLTPEWGSKTDETGVTTPALDGDCFKQLYGEDGKPLVTGRDWTCTQMTLESARLAPSKEYKMEITAFDGSLSSAPASVTFKTKAVEKQAEKPADNINTKLEVKNVKVLSDGTDLGTTGTVEIDDKGIATKELKFLWDSTYNAATIAQYSDTAKTKPALSYTWSITDSTGKTTVWALSKEWGNKSGEGVTKGDADCFKPLYGALAVGLDWMCNYTSLPGGIALKPDTTYTFTVTSFDGKASSTPATATFKTAKQVNLGLILDITNNKENTLYTNGANLNLNLDQSNQNIIKNVDKPVEQKLSAPDLSSGVTCKGDVCSLVINTHFQDYEYYSISQFKIKIDNTEITITPNKDKWDYDIYYHELSSVDLTKPHTFEVQILSNEEYGQQGGDDISKKQESEWGKYTYEPYINSFSVLAEASGSDMAKINLSWVDQEYTKNKAAYVYKLIREQRINPTPDCESKKKPGDLFACTGDIGFSQAPISDLTVYGDILLYTSYTTGKYNEEKIRIQRCLKDSDTCSPKSEYVYYHPAPILLISGDTLYWKPLDLDQSKIKSYTVSYRLTGEKYGSVNYGGWPFPKTLEINDPTTKSQKITTIINNTDPSTRTYEISIHKNYNDGTVNLESNKVNVTVTGSTATLASATPDYGFASLFDDALDSLFNIFK